MIYRVYVLLRGFKLRRWNKLFDKRMQKLKSHKGDRESYRRLRSQVWRVLDRMPA